MTSWCERNGHDWFPDDLGAVLACLRCPATTIPPVTSWNVQGGRVTVSGIDPALVGRFMARYGPGGPA